MTTTYYIPIESITGNKVSLPEEEAHHAVHVLRHKIGDEIVAVDGKGGWYRIRLERIGRRVAEGEIVELKEQIGEPSYSLTVGVALLKNQKRFDVFVEKASELGVSRIVPLVTSRTEKRSIKVNRVENILIAAMKQCGRSKQVECTEVLSLDETINRFSSSLTLCCHEKADEERTLIQSLESHQGSKDVLLLIGPEGGFTDEEVQKMKAHQIDTISLGVRRLRTETAAMAASTGVMLLWS